MNNFKTLCESILEEAKIDDAIKKAGLSDELAVKAKAIATGLGQKQTKFASFIVTNIETKEDLPALIQFFIDNGSRLDEKDINKYTAETLKAKMTELGKSNSQIGKEIEKDAPIVWKSADGRIVIRHILSWEASKKYGAGTKWCITKKDSDHYWKSYKARFLNFYFVHFTTFLKTDPNYKLAVVVSFNDRISSIFSAPDHDIIDTGMEILKKHNIPLDIFKGQVWDLFSRVFYFLNN